MIRTIADVFVTALLILRSWTGNLGLAIVLLTLFVKIALHPLTRLQLTSITAMRAQGAELEARREKHSGNPKQPKIDVTRPRPIGAVRGFSIFLPMLAQLIVLFALFAALRRPGLLYGEKFLGVGLEDVPTIGAMEENPLLATFPLLVVTTMYFQERVAGLTRSQAIVFAILVGWLAIQVPVAISLSWIVWGLAYALECGFVAWRSSGSGLWQSVAHWW